VAGGHAPQNGWPCKLVRSTGFPYRIFILTVLYGFGPYRTVTVPYMRSENVDTAYKHSTGTDTVACIYNVDGNCKGMLTPERPNILRKAFDRAKRSGLHDHVQPPSISFASELVGLIARKDISASKHTNKKIKDSFARILPSHITTAFQKWALVTKEKMASPLDYDPKSPHYWSEHPRDKVLGANTNAFSSQFSGFSICHPIYHENTMLLATRRAIYSAAVSTEETATFMLLPS